MIDWLSIFEQNGVDHVVGPAPNVRRGRIGIPCPMCGNDTAHHFSVDAETGRVVGCWRDRTHWMSPTELVARLTGLPFKRAKELTKNSDQLPTGDTPGAMLRLLDTPAKPTEPRPIRWAPDLRKFKGRPSEERFLGYLHARGFVRPLNVARQFGLRYATSGRWSSRIALPVWRFGGKPRLCGWSARAIGPSKARYIAEPAGDAMQRLLWESWEIEQGDVLVVVEGPFDGLKLAAAGVPGVTVVALLTNAAGHAKIARLLDLAAKARRVVVVLDQGAEGQALDLQAKLAQVRPQMIQVPEEYKDPGDLPLPVARKLLRSL